LVSRKVCPKSGNILTYGNKLDDETLMF